LKKYFSIDTDIAHNLVTLSLSDADFASLVSGKANAQRLFMGGKLKIKGNIMKATKMEPILKKAQGKAKL
jgi:putative sterol carrier protein